MISIFMSIFIIKFININKDISPLLALNLLWYPAFENLFSISRRILKKNNVSSPDKQHLHQIIFLYIKSKNLINVSFLNTFS